MEAERLPDLNIPRSGHSAFVVNGEATVVGGHTSGFVLTPTAEYFKDGRWHLQNTVYSHDGGFSVVLKSGKVMIAGGFKDNLGIGQSFEVETYDPVAHHFEGFGCLNQKRASAAAVELDSGQVLITGNWYADDGMELFDGHTSFSHLKTTRQSHYLPHLFKTSDGDVLVISGYDSKGQPFDTIMVDRMKSEPFCPPLLEIWHPLQYDLPLHSDESFIGDWSKGTYAYLLPVRNHDGQVAIAEVRDTLFSLLPTDNPVPTAGQWGEIIYYTPFYADRPHQRGYVMGCDSTGRQYALCVEYAQRPAHLTLYYTDPLTEVFAATIPVLTDDGNLMLTGIKPAVKQNSNFVPTAQVWLLRLGQSVAVEDTGHNSMAWWQWLCIAVIAAIVLAVLTRLILHKKQKTALTAEPVSATEPAIASKQAPAAEPDLATTINKANEQLIHRIINLIEDERLYLNSDLKTTDIAQRLGIHRNYVSSCINSQKGCSFAQLINGYRIEYAKQLMKEHPDKKLSAIFADAGFANETSFYRTFKAVTGMSPSEWMEKND